MTTDFPDLSNVPVYQSFFEDHDSYERYHIHLIGAEPLNEDGRPAIDKRRNFFGQPRAVDAVADPFVKVKTVGEDTGSTDFFPIGEHTFSVLEESSTPLWDAKCMVVAKKGTTQGITFTLLDKNSNAKDEVLMEFTLERSEMPDATPLKESTWTEFRKQDSGGNKRLKNMVLVFRIMVTDGSDRIVTQEGCQGFHQDFDNVKYTEVVVPDDTDDPEDNALLQCWRQEGANKAVLWILGRNDVFMHSHVAPILFLNNNYDLYVLNYKQNGHCRERGWVSDAHFNSHNKSGNFDVYLHDIAGALGIIGDDYDVMMGYAHSTGGPVLLNYLMERGDGAFDGFIFNSPFLDWGFVGGDLIEFALEHMKTLEKFGPLANDTKIGGAATTPEAFADTPIKYLKEEIVLSDWSAKFWSLYYFGWSMRPLYQVPVTVGFANGVTGVHRKLESHHEQRKAITSKPFLCITSRGDDVLKANETLSRADWIGPSRWEIELNDNGHDIFLSQDEGDTDMAIDMVHVWMKRMKFT